MSSSKIWSVNIKDPEVPLTVQDLRWPVRTLSCGNMCVNVVSEEGGVFVSSKIKDGAIQEWKQPAGLKNFEVAQVSSGTSHHVAMTTDSKLVSWGKNDRGQLGKGNISTKKKERNGIFFNASLIPIFQNLRVQQVSCGNAHTLCLTEEGQVYSWGANDCKQLGLREKASTAAVCSVPHQVRDLDCVHIGQISAGGQHSFALCVTGRVFCWGSNKHGQLGLEIGNINGNNYCYQVQQPAKCVEKAQSVECGENHTAFLSLDGRIYTSGLGSSGQLGHSNTENQFVPKQIEDLEYVSLIACGKNYTTAYIPASSKIHCFGAQRKCTINLPDHLNNIVMQCHKDYVFINQSTSRAGDYSRPTLTVDSLMDAMKYNDQEVSQREIKVMLRKVLSKASCLNRSFLVKNQNRNNKESSEYDCSVDFKEANEFFKEVRKPGYCQTAEQSLKTLLGDLSKSTPPNEGILRILLLLPCCLYGKESKAYNQDIVGSLAQLIAGLDVESKETFGKQAKNIPSENFKRCISFFKRRVKKKMGSIKKTLDQSVLSREIEIVKSCLEVLDMLNEINKLRRNPISHKKFYMKDLMALINLEGDFQSRLQDVKAMKEHTFRFCKYPFLYNSSAKLSLLRAECKAIMPRSVDMRIFLPTYSISAYELHVRRDRLLEYTRKGLSQKEEDLRKRLDIIFDGEMEYCGIGIRQEFFEILIKELLDEKFGAFYYEEESNEQWFCVKGGSNLEDIRFVGLICGLALYNGALLHLQFPSVMYKKLLNKPVSMEDLFPFKPAIYRSCKYVLDYHYDDIEDMGFDFATPVELCPNGSDIVVNHENKHEYISKVADHYLNKSVEKEFDAFHEGFYTGMPKWLLQSFHPKELEDILVGNERYDFGALQKAVKYEGDYYANDPTIQMFWDVFHDMELKDQQDFLKFLTGTQRIRAHGIGQMEVTIYPREEPGVHPNEMLPHALTCTYSLGLPRYTNREKMEEMLLCAARFCSGFSKDVLPNRNA